MKSGAHLPQQILKEFLAKKQAKNPSYTMTALARDLGLSQPQLSRIFSGKRSLTPALAQKMIEVLKLGKLDERRLFEAVMGQPSKKELNERVLETEKFN